MLIKKVNLKKKLLINFEYLYMLGKRIQIDQTRFESGFENIQ